MNRKEFCKWIKEQLSDEADRIEVIYCERM